MRHAIILLLDLHPALQLTQVEVVMMLVMNGGKSQRPIVTISVVLLNIDTVPHPYYHNCYQHHQHHLSTSVSIIIVIVIIIIIIVIVTIIVILNNIWGRRWCNSI